MNRKQFEISEKKQEILSEAHYICQYEGCSQPATQMAHRISQGKGNSKYIENYVRDKHGRYLSRQEIDRIIHHRLNIRASCAKHNDYFNIANQPVKRDALIDEIYKTIKEGV